MFEKGDIVEVITQNPDGSFLQIGDQGEIVSDVFEDGFVAVDFDFEFENSHNCDDAATNGWFVHVGNLKKIS